MMLEPPLLFVRNEFSNMINVGYRTKRVGFIGDGISKLLVLSPF